MSEKCSSDFCDSVIVSLNSHLKERSITTIANAVDLAIFADKATPPARKEMTGLFLSAHDEEEKEVTFEFVLIYPTLDFHVLTVQTPCLVSVLVYKGGFVI